MSSLHSFFPWLVRIYKAIQILLWRVPFWLIFNPINILQRGLAWKTLFVLSVGPLVQLVYPWGWSLPIYDSPLDYRLSKWPTIDFFCNKWALRSTPLKSIDKCWLHHYGLMVLQESFWKQNINNKNVVIIKSLEIRNRNKFENEYSQVPETTCFYPVNISITKM